MDTNEITEKRNEAYRWAYGKLFMQYVDRHLGHKANKKDIIDFNPYWWQPDSDELFELMREYEPFNKAVEEYSREVIGTKTEQIKNEVLENLRDARDLEQTNRVLAQTTKSI